MKYKVILSYDGSIYYGWNKQPNLVTIQESLEIAFKKITNQNVKIIASGRTDRYVHALNQVCSFETDYKINDPKQFIKKLNSLLLKIKIKEIVEVANNFSPRFDAKSKIYQYKLYLKDNKHAFENKDYQYNYYWPINIKELKEDSKAFLGKKNFASFTGKQDYYDYNRTIYNIKIKKYFNYLYIEIEGEGFMRFMVRNIVGTLLAKNRGKYSQKEFDDLFLNPIRGKSHYKAPGSGLYLKKVFY